MSAAEKLTMPPSPEAEILRQIEDLIRKLAAGDASQNELQLLQDLQKRRVELMQPSINRRRTSAAWVG
jgi:hypothetical protein